MNHPGGFADRNGRIVDVHPWHALFGNAYLWHELVHMYFAGYVVAGFVLAAVYSWGWLHGRRDRYARTALLVPLAVAALASPVQIVVGDWSGRVVARMQPIKLAAFEGLARTERAAPVHVLGWYDGKDVVDGIRIPRLLSLLAYHDPDATVRGLDSVPSGERPPVNVVRYAFQTMVGAGTAMAVVGVVFLVTWLRRRRLPESRRFHWAVVACAPLSILALYGGWVTTEVGRQPWVVYGVMRTKEAVTGAGGIPVGYATLVLVYAGLVVALVWILRRLARNPLEMGRPDEAR